jgi:HAD superfamily hydrolase (TIGR01509 family)
MGTIVEDPFYTAMPAFFGLSLRELVALLHPTSWVEFEQGLIDETTHASRFFRDGRAWDAAAFKEHVRSAYRYVEGMEALLAELGNRGVSMHVLSNYPCWYTLVEERLALSRYLPWTFVSCHMGVRKPDPEAFLLPARTLGVEPSRCLLVDDRAVNCEAAREVGMGAIRFEDAAALRGELCSRGIL